MKILFVFIISWIVLASIAVLLAINEVEDLFKSHKSSKDRRTQEPSSADLSEDDDHSLFWNLFAGVFISLSMPVVGIGICAIDLFDYFKKKKEER